MARDGRFKLYRQDGAWEYGFEVAAYDRTLPLVIDPVIIYSTYFGGTLNDYGLAVAVDDAGNAYVTGRTYLLIPLVSDLPGSTPMATSTSSCSRCPPRATFLIFSTLLGGTGSDGGRGVAVSPDGSVWVTGDTSSSIPFPPCPPCIPGGDCRMPLSLN